MGQILLTYGEMIDANQQAEDNTSFATDIAKAQLKKVVDYGNDVGWVANEVGGDLFCMKLEDWRALHKEAE